MTWFRVDDGLCGHRKTRRAGLPAMGLWTVAGSYSSQQLLDGFVPDWFVTTWPAGRKLAGALVSAGLWTAAEHDGDQGWQFHDWEQCNPLRAKVEDDREAARLRMQAARTAKEADSSRDVRANEQPNNGRSSDVRSPTPARPDPSLESKPSSPPKSRRATTIPTDWQPTAEQVAWLTAKCPAVHGRTETQQWQDWHLAKGDVAKDWAASWRTWMRKAQSYAERDTAVPVLRSLSNPKTPWKEWG